jgi:hypothetical protein
MSAVGRFLPIEAKKGVKSLIDYIRNLPKSTPSAISGQQKEEAP